MASTHDQGLGADEINLHTSVDTDNFCTGRSSTSIGSVDTVITNPLGPSNVLSGEKRHDGQDLRFLQSGDVLIVTGMPPGSIFGFDTTSFTLAKGCHYSGGVRGVRDIPPGPHFIYGGSSSELSTRNGFWIISQCRTPDEHGEVFVKRWDSYSETLEDEISASEVKIQRDNLPEIFNSLLPYGTFQGQQSPTNSLGVKDAGMWNRLTFAIKDTMLTRITGQPWNKWHVSSSQEVKNKEVNSPDSKINTLHDLAGGLEFAFPRTRVTFSNKVIGRARTEQAMDTSAHITSIIRERCTYEDEVMCFQLRMNVGCVIIIHFLRLLASFNSPTSMEYYLATLNVRSSGRMPSRLSSKHFGLRWICQCSFGKSLRQSTLSSYSMKRL